MAPPIPSSICWWAFHGPVGGAGVIISQRFGARDDEGVERAVHTTVGMTLVLGAIFTVLGILLAPVMLQLMNTPEEVFGEADTYLRIYFAGVSGLMLYNMGSGILRAVGDSRRPLYFLIFCSVVNTLLDLWFVLGLPHGGWKGHYATIIAQFLSAGLIFFVLGRSREKLPGPSEKDPHPPGYAGPDHRRGAPGGHPAGGDGLF